MSKEPVIMPVLPGSLNKTDRERLRRAGIIVIEHPDPTSVRMIRAGLPDIDAGDMLRCAMKALITQTSENSKTAALQREEFCKLVAATVQAKP